MRLQILASGSSGNAALFRVHKTCILIDAGLSARDLIERLDRAGEDIERVDVILVTHEHHDHAAALPVLARSHRFRGDIYLTEGTARAISWGDAEPRLKVFSSGDCFEVGSVSVQSFAVPHDGMDPVGFMLSTGQVRVGIAYDLGWMPTSVAEALRDTTALLIGCNHDSEMLSAGGYSCALKARISGPLGHLSNETVAKFLREFATPSLAHIIALHLSQENNHPELVGLLLRQVICDRAINARITIAEPYGAPEIHL
jgi:phosphoribosyl 1,2-cyclic phosphodiesterase